jgi:hypothetical protein
MIGIFYCATAGFFFFFLELDLCSWFWVNLDGFVFGKEKKINFYVHSRIQYVFLFNFMKKVLFFSL